MEAEKIEAEVKVLVADTHWLKIKNRIPKTVDDKKREIWFFETPALALKQQEIVLRARVHRKEKKAESTAKWRRWVPPYVSVRDLWDGPVSGFKAEIDASLNEGVPAWSVTENGLEEQRFLDVKEKQTPVRKFFNEHQRLLVEFAWPRLPWDQLSAWGPIESVKWELPDGIAIERWTVGGKSVIEVSKRGPRQDVVLEDIRAWLRADGIEAEELEGGKTAWALANLVQQP